MGYWVVVNKETMKSTTFAFKDHAEKERIWWEKHLRQTGRKLYSFAVIKAEIQ